MGEVSQNNKPSNGHQHRNVLDIISLRSYYYTTSRYCRQVCPKANETALLKVLRCSRLSCVKAASVKVHQRSRINAMGIL